VLIHVGRSHLDKGVSIRPDGTELAFMGEYLRRMTGLDMLHVDQQRFFAHPVPEDENPLYKHLLAKSGSTAPFVLKNKDGAMSSCAALLAGSTCWWSSRVTACATAVPPG
jgi:hypothetical protein